MSGLFKGVKKVFKKVTKFVKRYWKQIVIAAAIVFTAGVAMGYFGAAAAAGGGAASAATGVATGTGMTAATSGLATGTGALGMGTGGLMAGGTGAGLAAAGSTTAAGLATGSAALATGSAALTTGTTLAGGAITTLPTVTAVLPTGLGMGGVTMAETVGAAAIAGGGAAWSQAASKVAPQASEVSQTELPGEGGGNTPPPDAGGSKLAKVGKWGKETWNGMSSFEKASLLSTGVQMASALTAKDERQGNEFPMQESFYARDKDGKGPGAAYDYDPSSGKMVRGSGAPPQGTDTAPFAALSGQPQAGGQPQRYAGQQQAPARSPIPESFLSRSDEREDDLDNRMKFITGGRG